MKSIEINAEDTITGYSRTYKPSKKIEFDFNPETYVFQNCVCCFYINVPHSDGFERKYVCLKYFEEMSEDDINGFKTAKYSPNGFYVLQVDNRADAEAIIKDISESPFFED